MSNVRFALTAALIAACLTGCAGNLPTSATIKVKPTAAAGVKAVLKPTAAAKPVAAAQALRQAPSVSVLKGAAPAEVQGEEALAAGADAALDQTLEALDVFADDGYQLQGLFADLKAKIQGGFKRMAPTKLKELVTRRAKRQHAVEKRAEGREALKAALKKVQWVDNGDGTKSKALDLQSTVTIEGQTFARHLTGTITRDAETNVLLKAEGQVVQALPKGASLVATSTRTLQDDGTYLVVRHSLTTLKGGATRTGDHTRTIATDGSFKGEGTVTWVNAKGATIATRTWTFAGNEDDAAVDEVPVADEAPVAVDGAPVEAVPADEAIDDEFVSGDEAIGV